MNSVNIIGRLVRDPDVRKSQAGLTICGIRLAVDDNHTKEDRADFINVTVFGKQAVNCAKWLSKGMPCGVSGRIRSDEYTDKDGVKRYPIKVTADYVQFLEYPRRGGENAQNAQNAQEQGQAPQPQETAQQTAAPQAYAPAPPQAYAPVPQAPAPTEGRAEETPF